MGGGDRIVGTKYGGDKILETKYGGVIESWQPNMGGVIESHAVYLPNSLAPPGRKKMTTP